MNISSELLSIQSAHRQALTGLYNGDRMADAFFLTGSYAGYYGDTDDASLTAWREKDMAGVVDGILQAGTDPLTFNPLVMEFNPLGVHYVDAIFGARVYRQDEQIWNDILAGGLAALRPVDVAAVPMVQWSLRAIADMLNEVPEPVCVSTPIFSSPLNVAINLFGEDGLMDMLDADAAVLRGLDIITDVICDLHLLFMTTFPGGRVRFYCSSTRYAPDGIGHICGCSTQLLGQETYREYFSPRDSRVLSAYPNGGHIHLCGRHTQHISTWRDMPALRAVQLNDAAADDLPAYFNGLRHDQIIYIGPTETMTIEKIIAVTGGQRIIIQAQKPVY